VLGVLISFARPAAADGPAERLSVMAGMTQWIIFRGGNLAFEYMRGRLVFEVSHGQGLDLNQAPSLALKSAEQDAGVRILVPWTTGGGVGYRITDHLHILIEAKAHHYRVNARDRNDELHYTTFSVGPGVFYSFRLYKGVFLEPNLRWWPNVASTLPGGHGSLRQPDGTTYDHQAHDFGLFANANLGWTF
jgi:hypothetical protein